MKMRIFLGVILAVAVGLLLFRLTTKDKKAEVTARQPIQAMTSGMPNPATGHETMQVIPQNAGGISIGELYKNRDKYSGQKIRVKGKVVKVNAEIMDRNWIHLQDGTGDEGNFDLTVTSSETASVGDVAEFEGIITLNKDFGAGYMYELIMEEGKKK